MKKRRILLPIVIISLILAVAATIFFYGRSVALPHKYNDYIEKYSKEYDLNPDLVRAVIKTESNYREKAVSPAKAYGLMQITKSTGEYIASNLGVNNFNEEILFNPETNIEFGCWYLNNLRTEFDNQNNELAAYNAGRGNVQAWLKNSAYSKDGENLDKIPFPETAAYVKKVAKYEKLYEKFY